ncbi:citrate synthase [Lipingzhangella halophila]|uniref:Citrate synthase n=1 Tax=Lipingzhangella halophila TaxID=1783352 RepID=A0A7W7RP28_9ACTN|nr:citrate synthase [Lipingzhangella halophila]MBB4935048.1 citrate synthase [Lipingzhangella halophila]
MSEEGKERTAELQYGEGALSLPVLTGSEGDEAIEVKSLLAKTGKVALDPGFVNTASCSSAITYIDGDAGILRYRGYPIQELATGSSFIEVCHLLIYGELPGPGELKELADKLRQNAGIPDEMRTMLDALPREGHPMTLLGSAVNLLAAYYPDSVDLSDPDQVELATIRLLAKLPTIAAHIYRNSIGEQPVDPDPSLGYVENFLHMTFGKEKGEGELGSLFVKAMDLLLILHADHEQNCSTATVRVVGSSEADIYGSVSGGIHALFGPLHGGANQAVLEMLEEIRSSGTDLDTFLERVKARETRLMGFGHRVYKNFDPRSKEIKGLASQILDNQERPDELFELALQLEAKALADPYFTERKLYPNVDFYTGVIYRAMGFPTTMFTVLFAIGRLPGWIAHWREQAADQTSRIARPRQLYTGPGQRSYPGRA